MSRPAYAHRVPVTLLLANHLFHLAPCVLIPRVFLPFHGFCRFRANDLRQISKKGDFNSVRLSGTRCSFETLGNSDVVEKRGKQKGGERFARLRAPLNLDGQNLFSCLAFYSSRRLKLVRRIINCRLVVLSKFLNHLTLRVHHVVFMFNIILTVSFILSSFI